MNDYPGEIFELNEQEIEIECLREWSAEPLSEICAPGRSLSVIGCCDQPGRFLPRAQQRRPRQKTPCDFAGSHENQIKFGS